MARLLILGGGRCGLELARAVAGEGHATRVVTRREGRRAEIEGAGAECWIGDPDRLATLRGALDGVTIACWLLGSAAGSEEELRELHGSRLRSFIGQAIDTTMRGFVYEAAGSVAPEILDEGERIAVAACARNEIPLAVLPAARSAAGAGSVASGCGADEAGTGASPRGADRAGRGAWDWQREARYAVSNLLKTDRDS